jgi:enoyl-CoA hydratase
LSELSSKESIAGQTGQYSNIILKREPPIGEVHLNRPSALNALSSALLKDLMSGLLQLESDSEIKSIVLTGSDRVFSAGADIKEMSEMGAIEALKAGNLDLFDQIYSKIKKPLVAAVNGFCFGGGLELAMTCDIIVAGENARLGQPEINIGVMPGAGGTQRLTKAIGKYKAMDLILTGRQISAKDAFEWGLVSRVVPDESCLAEALKIALDLSTKSPLALRVAKECGKKALDSGLSEGVEFERKNFYILLDSEDKNEGMKAFAEKRKPSFKGS